MVVLANLQNKKCHKLPVSVGWGGEKLLGQFKLFQTIRAIQLFPQNYPFQWDLFGKSFQGLNHGGAAGFSGNLKELGYWLPNRFLAALASPYLPLVVVVTE